MREEELVARRRKKNSCFPNPSSPARASQLVASSQAAERSLFIICQSKMTGAVMVLVDN